MENWFKLFKKALEEQQSFPFSQDPSLQGGKPEITPEQKEWMNRVAPADIGSLIDLLAETNNKDEFMALFNRVGSSFDLEEVQLVNGPVYVLSERSRDYRKKQYVIDDFDPPSFKDAREWLTEIWDHNLDNYVPSEDFNKTFWDEVGPGSYLYHGTSAENAAIIQKSGLSMKDETRGINNRSTGAAVFTSDNPDDISAYGDTVFQIDIGRMKVDGYMPNVEREGPIETALQKQRLAYLLGVEDYNVTDEYASEGLYESTVVIYGGIPAKYLSIYQG